MLAKHIPRPRTRIQCLQCSCQHRLVWSRRDHSSSSSSSSSGEQHDGPRSNSSNSNQRATTPTTPSRSPSSRPADSEPNLAHLKAHLANLQMPTPSSSPPFSSSSSSSSSQQHAPPRFPRPHSRIPSLAGPPPSEIAQIQKDLAGLSLPVRPNRPSRYRPPPQPQQQQQQTPPSHHKLVQFQKAPQSNYTWSDIDPTSLTPGLRQPRRLRDSHSQQPGRHGQLGQGDADGRGTDVDRNTDQKDLWRTFRRIVLPKDRGKLTDKEVGVDPDSLLLVYDVSPSLIASDFFRVGQQGKHIGGWASGLLDVLQRFDFDTLRPLGEYILHFTTRAAAASWISNANTRRRFAHTLHTTSRAAATLLASDADAAAARGYSLTCPAPAGHVAALRGAIRGSVALAYMRAVALRRLLRDELHVARAMLVVSLEGERPSNVSARDGRAVDDGGGGGKFVITSAVLRKVVQEDAAAAGYEWAIVRAREWGSSQQGGVEGEDGGGGGEAEEEVAQQPRGTSRGASRFVVSFTTNDEAHRFVRWWHRRRIMMSVPGPSGRASPVSVPVTFNVHHLTLD